MNAQTRRCHPTTLRPFLPSARSNRKSSSNRPTAPPQVRGRSQDDHPGQRRKDRRLLLPRLWTVAEHHLLPRPFLLTPKKTLLDPHRMRQSSVSDRKSKTNHRRGVSFVHCSAFPLKKSSSIPVRAVPKFVRQGPSCVRPCGLKQRRLRVIHHPNHHARGPYRSQLWNAAQAHRRPPPRRAVLLQ